MNRITGYSVRRHGLTEWCRCATRAEAERERAIADRTMAPGHEIIAIYAEPKDVDADDE